LFIPKKYEHKQGLIMRTEAVFAQFKTLWLFGLNKLSV